MAGNRPFEPQRFRELIIYLAELSKDDVWFGATKLNKVLYYCDFIAYRRLGSSITGANYHKLSEGPAPRQLLSERKSLVTEESARIDTVPVFNYVQQRISPLRKADLSHFTAQELDVIREVVRTLGSLSAREVSEMSHAEVGWAASVHGEEIPYVTAFLVAGPVPAEIEWRALEGKI